MIRRFLDKIGAYEPGKLRVVGSSASMNEDNKDFLEEFFGLPKETFHIISNPPVIDERKEIDGERLKKEIIEKKFSNIKNDDWDYLFFNAYKDLLEQDAKDFSLETIASEQATMGSLINCLNFSISNQSKASVMTEQAVGRIMDSDFATETTNLSKQQILNQAATSMLAQANQSKQSILALLQ